MDYQKNYARGIKTPMFIKSSTKKDGIIKMFLDTVKKDNRFVIHIRNNYFNVYYKSGNVARIDSSLKPKIDNNYFKYSHVKKENVIELFEVGKYTEYLNVMVDVMESYWDGLFYKKHLKTEKRLEDEGNVQQEISINNKNHLTDFDVLDLEYQISSDMENPLRYDGNTPYPVATINKETREVNKHKKISPRFDIVAISNGKLYVIELKKGTSALRGPSGMHDHIDSFLHTIAKNEETKALFVEEMKNLLKQKKDFGLICKDLQIESDDVEFCFAYSYKQPTNKRTREYKSVNSVINSIDKEGIKPLNYKIIYLEPDEYKLFLK